MAVGGHTTVIQRVLERREKSSSAIDAARLRTLLCRSDLTEEAAATVLEIDKADLRAYSGGEKPVPRIVILASERVADLRR